MLSVAGAEKGTKYYAARLIREKANGHARKYRPLNCPAEITSIATRGGRSGSRLLAVNRGPPKSLRRIPRPRNCGGKKTSGNSSHLRLGKKDDYKHTHPEKRLHERQ